ncbi:hypothetical protein MRX96_050691 [Rhipicephalus microplus]
MNDNETSFRRNALTYLGEGIANCKQTTRVAHRGKLEKRTERIVFEASTIETAALGEIREHVGDDYFPVISSAEALSFLVFLGEFQAEQEGFGSDLRSRSNQIHVMQVDEKNKHR